MKRGAQYFLQVARTTTSSNRGSAIPDGKSSGWLYAKEGIGNQPPRLYGGLDLGDEGVDKQKAPTRCGGRHYLFVNNDGGGWGGHGLDRLAEVANLAIDADDLAPDIADVRTLREFEEGVEVCGQEEADDADRVREDVGDIGCAANEAALDGLFASEVLVVLCVVILVELDLGLGRTQGATEEVMVGPLVGELELTLRAVELCRSTSGSGEHGRGGSSSGGTRCSGGGRREEAMDDAEIFTGHACEGDVCVWLGGGGGGGARNGRAAVGDGARGDLGGDGAGGGSGGGDCGRLSWFSVGDWGCED